MANYVNKISKQGTEYEIYDERIDANISSSDSGKVLGVNASGKIVAQQAAEGGVTSFNGRQGAVTPANGDYTASMVGAIDSSEKGATNGVATLSSGKVPTTQLPTSSTSASGIVQLNNNINSTSTTQAATANAVKTAYDLANANKASEVSATLSTTWTGSAAPYTQSVNITGMTTSTIGIFGVAYSATQAQYQAAQKAQLRVTAQSSGKITVTAYGEKPTTTIPVTVQILG